MASPTNTSVFFPQNTFLSFPAAGLSGLPTKLTIDTASLVAGLPAGLQQVAPGAAQVQGREGQPLVVSVQASDSEDDPLVYFVRNLPPGAIFDPARDLYLDDDVSATLKTGRAGWDQALV